MLVEYAVRKDEEDFCVVTTQRRLTLPTFVQG